MSSKRSGCDSALNQKVIAYRESLGTEQWSTNAILVKLTHYSPLQEATIPDFLAKQQEVHTLARNVTSPGLLVRGQQTFL